ncbi:sensor histidine kinase [uncultured Cellulomonas sp.]|uniref:sensor histidine kinase n=1 Tax=uncultured Cellulomonas sp. TaxID=189682 RepID=UPI00260F3F82|nr:histidine kinase [uncultured Cellulomonas sp.]
MLRRTTTPDRATRGPASPSAVPATATAGTASGTAVPAVRPSVPPTAGPPSPAPPAARAAGRTGSTADPLFTELTARRLGPVRRYFLRHPVVMDLVVVAWFAVPATLGALIDPTGPPVLLLVATLLGAAALFGRRRAPVRTAIAVGVLSVATIAVTGGSNGYDLAIALALYAVAASSRPRTAWLTLAGLCVTTSVAILLREQPMVIDGPNVTVATEGPDGATDTVTDLRAASITTLVMFSLVAIAVGSSVRNRRLHVAALVDRANALTVERDQQAQLAAAAERTRIAREMHDVVAHSLSVMIALGDGAAAALDRSPERARAALGELSDTGRAALTDMRRVLGALRDPDAPFDPQPGAGDLDHLVDRFRAAGLPVRWTSTGPPLPPDAGLELAVYRIVQESLTNVLRHAPGTAWVDLRLDRTDHGVDITVTDGGGARGGGSPRSAAASGTAAAPGTVGTGRGVVGMRERAAVLGGRVDAGPHDGGWRVHAVLRWDERTP